MSYSPLQIMQLDFSIRQYTTKLYTRAKGQIQYLFGGDAVVLSNPDLHKKCTQRAVAKFTPKTVNQNNEVLNNYCTQVDWKQFWQDHKDNNIK